MFSRKFRSTSHSCIILRCSMHQPFLFSIMIWALCFHHLSRWDVMIASLLLSWLRFQLPGCHQILPLLQWLCSGPCVCQIWWWWCFSFWCWKKWMKSDVWITVEISVSILHLRSLTYSASIPVSLSVAKESLHNNWLGYWVLT